MLRDTDGVHGQRLAGGRVRPTRAEIDPVALDLLARFGPSILRQARKFSLTPEDAEDAYQRGVEILLTKAPTTEEHGLLAWLKTVVKHEALAIRKQRDRVLPVAEDGVVESSTAPEAGTHDHAERLERLRLGAEALGNLKPQEVRCLLLKAEGFSYRQIQAATGFSYTKVDRCLKEGRRSFLAQVEGIESGAECRRLSGMLSRFADSEAAPAEVAALRPHLRSCLQCRSRLREYRAAPARVAALIPVAAVTLQPASASGGPGRFLEGVAGSAQERLAVVSEKAHGLAELVSAGKIAAVAASTVAIAGGGTVAVQELRTQEAKPTPSRADPGASLAAEGVPGAVARPAPVADSPTHDPPPAPVGRGGPTPQRSREPAHKGSVRDTGPPAQAPVAQAREFEAGPVPAGTSAPAAPTPFTPSKPGPANTGGSEFSGP